MPAKKVAPFKNILSLYAQDSGFFEVEGNSFYCCGLNTGSKNDEYNFTENEIKFMASHATGWVDGNNVYFLAKVPKDSKGKIFDLTIKGKDFKPDKQKTDEENEKWDSGKGLIAIDCSSIPPLKILAEVLHEKKLIAVGNVRIMLNAQLDQVRETLIDFFDHMIENGKFPTSSDEIFTKLPTLQNSVGLLNPFTKHFPIPETPEINEFGFPTGNMIIDSIPFEGEFPDIQKIIFSAPPKAEQKSNGNRNWGGSTSVNVEGYQAKEAWSFVKDHFQEIKEFFGLDNASAIHVSLSLAGVNALPNIYPMIKESYLPEKIIATNGHKAIAPTEDQGNAGEDKTEDPEPAESIEQHIIRRFTTLKLDHEKWLKRHTDQEERELILRITDNVVYMKHEDQIKTWCGEKMGTDLPIPITALPNKELLLELFNLIKDTEAKMEIDPKATFVGAK